jgi:PPK2 family polyphosphate:nucleotide phosphotransferase
MIKLTNVATAPPETYTKAYCKEALIGFQKKLFALQNMFYADGRFGLLIIMQGIDTAGKDGTVRHVMSCMNPLGVNVKAFKAPTAEEAKHDFLWRIYPHFPQRGMIQVFNRSYYEDITVPLVENKLSKKSLNQRVTFIQQLEQHLTGSNIHILKFYLHLSAAEQKERIEERKTLDSKKWKYDKTDDLAADKFQDYHHVYEQMINECDQPTWHIIPADKRWYRNYAVAKVLTGFLESLQLKYPTQEAE